MHMWRETPFFPALIRQNGENPRPARVRKVNETNMIANFSYSKGVSPKPQTHNNLRFLVILPLENHQ